MFRKAFAALLALGLVVCSATARAADPVAGKVIAQAQCVHCHEADDWDGEDAAALESLIADIVAGRVKHKNKLQLSATEIANIAAYWALGRI